LVSAALKKCGLIVNIRPSFQEIYVILKSLVISEQIALSLSKELKDGLLSTQAYYYRSNTLSIAHSRTSSGHADLADAVTTAIYERSKKRFKDESKPKYRFTISGPGIFYYVEISPKPKPIMKVERF